jgi:predicted O-methyltransferase YrrM
MSARPKHSGGADPQTNGESSRRARAAHRQVVRHQETTVGDPLETLKTELERFGEANDAETNERPRRMLNITRDTGEFLSVLVRAAVARRVLEIGTSNGYSTLWLADAARAIGGSVTTVEFAEYKVGLAAATFTRSGLSPFITLVHDDAGQQSRRRSFPCGHPALRTCYGSP